MELATAIVLVEYRLMLIAFVVLTPALIAIIDAVMLEAAACFGGAVLAVTIKVLLHRLIERTAAHANAGKVR